jgi:hypothetical protein
MARQLRRFAAVLALAAVLFAPSASLAATNIDTVGDQGSPPMVDLFLMRPLGLMMLGASCMVFVPAAALTAMVRPADLHVTYEILVQEPVRFVFVDPLGSH